MPTDPETHEGSPSRISELGGESGATAVEYALMISLIALVIVAAVAVLGTSVADLYERFGAATGWF